MNTLGHQSTQSEVEPNWELLQEVAGFMAGQQRADVIQLMSRLTDADINVCSLNFQQEFWEEMVIADHEEALNYRGKYMDKPFGIAILKKIALEDPAFMIGKSLSNPKNETYQKLYRFLIRELGREKIEELVKARNNVWYRRLFRKILGEDEPTT